MAVPAGKPKRSLIAPTEDEWRAMSPDERMRLLVDINEGLSDPPIAMSEGRPHKKAKSAVLDKLGLHYSSTGRAIYLAEEMAVLYPGQESFSPNILVVLDIPQPEDDERMAWVVVEEGKGLDLVIEVLHRGDRHKDLVANVERYAQLSIPEYFIYDRLRQQIHGYRLPRPKATRYERVVPQFGRYASIVLGLDLAVVGGNLRFYYGQAELICTADLIDRLKGMMEDLEAKADQAQAQAEQARDALRASILALLSARGLACPEEAQARVSSCDDLSTLQRLLLRAATAGTVEEILSA